jgi:hypothetical protein
MFINGARNNPVHNYLKNLERLAKEKCRFIRV